MLPLAKGRVKRFFGAELDAMESGDCHIIGIRV
jgi:hypothetical protein